MNRRYGSDSERSKKIADIEKLLAIKGKLSSDRLEAGDGAKIDEVISLLLTELVEGLTPVEVDFATIAYSDEDRRRIRAMLYRPGDEELERPRDEEPDDAEPGE